MRTNNLHLLVVSWLLKYWMHCMTRYKSSPAPLSSPHYSLFHPPCSHPQHLDVCRRVKACAQGNVDMLSLTLDTCFVIVFFVLMHTSKEETVNVKPNSMRLCVSRQNRRFSNPTTIESTDATFAWMRPDAWNVMLSGFLILPYRTYRMVRKRIWSGSQTLFQVQN